MSAPIVVVPEILETVPIEVVPTIERWEAGCREDLRRRARELGDLTRQIASVEQSSAPDDLIPAAVLAEIEARFDDARSTTASVLAMARAEADGIVERAASFAANLVRIAGLDPSTVDGLRPRDRSASPNEIAMRSVVDLRDDALAGSVFRSPVDDFFASEAEAGMDPDRDFWSEIPRSRSTGGRLRRLVSEDRS